MLTGEREVPGQPAAAASAVLSTQSPSGTISPEASAAAMKAVGFSSPRSGCRQRSSVSNPAIRSSARSM